MAEWVILSLLALTSALAFAVGIGPLGLSARALGRAVGWFLECLGLGCGFFLLNLGIGIAGVLAARATSAGFISLYYVNDLAVAAVSVLQGVLFWSWRMASAARRT